jgi:sugar phosphate isomerase/epimerase
MIPSAPARTSMGVAAFSFARRQAFDRARGAADGIGDPFTFLETARALGAGGIQTSLGRLGPGRAAELRRLAEEHGMWIEGSEALPRKPEDVGRFDAAMQSLKAAGATVFRTVLLGGRRYEAFDRPEPWEAFRRDARAWLELAEPVLARHRIVAAFENHKDFRVPELLPFLKSVGSPWIAVCADFSNNFTLLEDPHETVEALAPVSAAAHVKDMAVGDDPEGFLAADMPLGKGFLDLPRMIAALRRANPRLRLSLEMSTRDPLRVPVFTEKYWVTMKDVPASDLARTLGTVAARRSPPGALPEISRLSPEEGARVEAENIRVSLAYAGGTLGL